jgi:hypothetical protein
MRRSCLIIAVSFWVASGAPGAPIAWAQAPDTFGTASEVVHVVGAWEFTEVVGDAHATHGGNRICLAASCSLFAHLRLPSGALVSRIELDGCDTDASAFMVAYLYRTSAPANDAVPFDALNPFTGTGTSETPGCVLRSGALFSALSIDNKSFNYLITVSLIPSAPGAPGLSFMAVRVYYTLQVSAAPATATFGDVPRSHPFFRYVEALVASGITAGCGGGNYCPDAPLTRGQMAVFLSKALGLHFAP